MALGTDVMDGNGDLTVGLLARRPAILPLHPDGAVALLGERHVVEQEDPVGAGKGLRQTGTISGEHSLLVPRTLADELLQGLLGIGADQSVGKGDPMRKGFDALAFAVQKQSLKINPRPFRRLGLRKIRGEQAGIFLKAFQDGRVEFGSVSLHARLEFGIVPTIPNSNGVVLITLGRISVRSVDRRFDRPVVRGRAARSWRAGRISTKTRPPPPD